MVFAAALKITFPELFELTGYRDQAGGSLRDSDPLSHLKRLASEELDLLRNKVGAPAARGLQP